MQPQRIPDKRIAATANSFLFFIRVSILPRWGGEITEKEILECQITVSLFGRKVKGVAQRKCVSNRKKQIVSFWPFTKGDFARIMLRGGDCIAGYVCSGWNSVCVCVGGICLESKGRGKPGALKVAFGTVCLCLSPGDGVQELFFELYGFVYPGKLLCVVGFTGGIVGGDRCIRSIGAHANQRTIRAKYLQVFADCAELRLYGLRIGGESVW